MEPCGQMIVFLFSFYLCQYTESATFLGIVFPVKGQLIELQTLILGLVDRGHQGYLAVGEHALPYLPTTLTNNEHVPLLTFKTRSADFMLFEDKEEQRNGLLAFFDDPYERIFPFKAIAFRNKVKKLMTTEYTEDMLKDDIFNNRIKELGIDMAVLHNAFGFFPTSYLLPYKHSIPYITSSFIPHPLSGISLLPSFIPHPFNTGAYTDKMTFSQRMGNFLMYKLFAVLLKPGEYPENLFIDYLPGLPKKTFPELISASELFIVTGKHPAIDYPQPTMPNTIFAGGMNTQPGKPLSPELQKFMDAHKNGVIVVSFGSWTNYFPEHITTKFLAAFEQLDYGVIWRFTGPKPSGIPEPIKLSLWLPQNDLLAHPNTKLFISHCGNGGTFEALYHGIPVLGFPLFADQVYNSNKFQHRGLSLTMDITEFSTEALVDNINKMIHNSSFYDTAKKLSVIYHDQQWTAQQQAAHWIEHVLKHGGSYLRSPSAAMPWYQYYLVDVILFLLTVIVCTVLLCIVCCKCICRNCCESKAIAPSERKVK
ncbi:UDP-glucuronosyltransferase 2C1-like [Lingula anatina]|uniref:UDP-glucuronosyltransferase 2C1-like n=1 Tax=Lingula anatina TaxID=7574 RepID=A0A1S3JR52_LINAN|nr:UDP-glucuronosyltransferase 2C1-like [Lingula anatina]|eukprot:XP_013412817.1 UDP-glucuronosyltransferase 2C1-like [Lingula anatina]